MIGSLQLIVHDWFTSIDTNSQLPVLTAKLLGHDDHLGGHVHARHPLPPLHDLAGVPEQHQVAPLGGGVGGHLLPGGISHPHPLNVDDTLLETPCQTVKAVWCGREEMLCN